MPRAKMILTNLKAGSRMKEWGFYIYNGTALSFIFPKGTEVIARPSYRCQYALVKSVDGSSREYCVNRSELQEYVKVKPVKYLVTKKDKVFEMFACGEKDAKETARKMLKMQRLTKVQITEVGASSFWNPFMVGVKVRVVRGVNEGKEMILRYNYYEDCFMGSEVGTGIGHVLYTKDLIRV